MHTLIRTTEGSSKSPVRPRTPEPQHSPRQGAALLKSNNHSFLKGFSETSNLARTKVRKRPEISFLKPLEETLPVWKLQVSLLSRLLGRGGVYNPQFRLN